MVFRIDMYFVFLKEGYYFIVNYIHSFCYDYSDNKPHKYK